MRTKTNPQIHCISFKDAIKQMRVLDQPGLMVKYFKIVVVGDKGGKLTLAFDPIKFRKTKP